MHIKVRKSMISNFLAARLIRPASKASLVSSVLEIPSISSKSNKFGVAVFLHDNDN